MLPWLQLGWSTEQYWHKRNVLNTTINSEIITYWYSTGIIDLLMWSTYEGQSMPHVE
jgi:hypothetical protein